MIRFTQHKQPGSSPQYWVRILRDGAIVARSETYTSTASCDNAVDAVKRGRVRYEVYVASDGHRFRIKGLNGEIIFQSTDRYSSAAAAGFVVEAIKTGAGPAQYLAA